MTDRKYNVYHGIVNPKAEPTGKWTTYFSEEQIPGLIKELPGLKVYIEHFDKVESSGEVIAAAVHPKTGKLWISCAVYNDTVNGEKANLLLNEKNKFKMKDFSLGQTAVKLKGDLKVIGNIPKEVSICWNGAREGTVIKSKMSKDEYINKVKNIYNKEKQNTKNLQKQNIDQMNQNNKINENELLALKEKARIEFDQRNNNNSSNGQLLSIEQLNAKNALNSARQQMGNGSSSAKRGLELVQSNASNISTDPQVSEDFKKAAIEVNRNSLNISKDPAIIDKKS